MKKIIFSFLLLNILVFINLNAKTSENNILLILKLCPDVILDSNGEKHYLDYDFLSFSTEGIAIRKSNVFIPIKKIGFDKRGYFLKENLSENKKKAEDFEIWQCNQCDTIFYPTPSNGYKCPKCGSRDAKPIHY